MVSDLDGPLEEISKQWEEKYQAILHMLLLNTWEKQTKKMPQDFPGGAVVKNLPANAGDEGSSPGPGRSHMPQSN